MVQWHVRWEGRYDDVLNWRCDRFGRWDGGLFGTVDRTSGHWGLVIYFFTYTRVLIITISSLGLNHIIFGLFVRGFVHVAHHRVLVYYLEALALFRPGLAWFKKDFFLELYVFIQHLLIEFLLFGELCRYTVDEVVQLGNLLVFLSDGSFEVLNLLLAGLVVLGQFSHYWTLYVGPHFQT